MPAMTSYEHGVPSWVDLGTGDLPGAVRFYSALLGWQTQDMGEASGHYNIAFKDGKQVAGMTAAQDSAPARWTMHVNVDDADAVAAKVATSGGKLLFDPMDVMDLGRMAAFVDSTGAMTSAWQPRRHIGAELVNEPGAFIWSELSTSDLEKSKAFYAEVFGWSWGGAPEYAEAQVSGRTVAGVMPRRPDMPAEIPDSWLVYFGADDVDADTERAKELGGTVVVAPTDIPGTGRFAVLLDPQGAAFALFKG
jgi:uncharacterized protein